MCPMRFLLVFFSAILAGYFAWRTARSSPETEFTRTSESSSMEEKTSKDKQETNFKKMVVNSFWVFVDMASGKYLWRNLRDLKKDEKVKSR